MRKIRVNMCLPPDQWQQVRAVARRRRMSAGEFVSHVLQGVLAEEGQSKEKRMAALERLFSLNLGAMGTPEELNALIADAAMPTGADDAPL